MAGTSAALAVDLDQQVPFDIPPGSLAKALIEFSKQAHIQVLSSGDRTKQATTDGLSGTFTIRAGLTRLLKNSGLRFKSMGMDAVAIEATTNDGARNGETPAAAGDAHAAALAQVDETPSSKASGKDPQTVESAEKHEQKAALLEEVIVTGSRIPTVAGQQVVPVRGYTREQLDRSGQTRITDFLNTLPDVSLGSPDSAAGPTYANQATIRMHGLPVGTTLVLLNGRRVNNNNYGFFDLNIIPMAAVERIDVLPVGASAIYGSDALAGAVNFILKKEFSGFGTDFNYGHANDISQEGGTLSWGYGGDRGAIALMGAYQKVGALMGTQRASIINSTIGVRPDDACNPGNVYSLNGGNLPGLNSPQAAVPAGLTGTATIQDFVATAGRNNSCREYVAGTTLISPSEREGVLLTGHYALSESVDLFTEVLTSHETVSNAIGPAVGPQASFGDVLAAGNPYNPFGQDVGISYSWPSGTSEAFDRTTTFVRPLVGIKGSFWKDWNYELTGFLSEDWSHTAEFFHNTAAQSAALASTDPATALNPFTSGPPVSPVVLAAFLLPPNRYSFFSRTVSSQGILRGELFDLPAGSAQAVFGSEYDQSKILTTNNGVFNRSRNSYAFFTETKVPLLADREHAANGETLSISLAGRYDNSNDFGGKTTGQGGLEWRPTESLLLRGAYATSYLAPQLTQLFGPVFLGSRSGPVDPFRGNEVIHLVPTALGANPNLNPETGQSRTFGFVYSSKAAPGFEMIVNFWSLNIKNYITLPNLRDLINYPNVFPNAVTRNPPTAQDQANGYLGVITHINDIFFNYGDFNVAGIDSDMSYTVQTKFGQLTSSIALTETYKYDTKLRPGLPLVDHVSKVSGPGFAPRWRGNAGLSWKQGSYTVNMTMRWVSSYLDDQSTVANTHELGNFWIFDANSRYALGNMFRSNKWLASSYISVGGINLLNRLPQASYSAGNGFDFDSQSDVRGRYIYTQIGLNW